jgi:hypothetical protein
MRGGKCVRLIGGVVMGLTALGALAGGARWYFGSFHAISLYFNGQSFVVEPTHCDVGSGCVGESRKVTLHIRNLTYGSISVVGLRVSCSCISGTPLPVAIGPRETREFGLVFRFPRTSNHFRQYVILLFDDQSVMRQVPILVTGKCIGAEQDGEPRVSNGPSSRFSIVASHTR